MIYDFKATFKGSIEGYLWSSIILSLRIKDPYFSLKLVNIQTNNSNNSTFSESRLLCNFALMSKQYFSNTLYIIKK